MKVEASLQPTTLFGTASAWPAKKNPEGVNSLLALEVGSIFSSNDMNIDYVRYSEGDVLTSSTPDGAGAEWVVRFEATCISCYGYEGSNSVYIAGGNNTLSVAAVEEMQSTYNENRSSTNPYMSPYDLVRFFATTCNSVESIGEALQDLIIWNDICHATNQPLGLKFLILAQNRTVVLTFVNGIPQLNEDTIGMIGSGVQESEIVQLAGGYDFGNIVPTGKMINGQEVRSLGPGSNGRLVGGFSTLSKLTRVASLYKHYQKLTANDWNKNIDIVWPVLASVIVPPGSSKAQAGGHLRDISTRISLIITNGMAISLSQTKSGTESLKEMMQNLKTEALLRNENWTVEHKTRGGITRTHLKQIASAPSIPSELKGSLPISYYFQGASMMQCPYDDLIALGNFNGLSLSDTDSPVEPSYFEAGRSWTSVSSLGVKGLTWDQTIAFECINPPEKVKRDIPIVLFAQNPTLMVRLLSYTPSTYSPEGFIPGQSVGALDLACLIAGTCYSIKEVKELLEGKKLGLLNIVDQALPAQGGFPHLQYHIGARPDRQDDPFEVPVVLYFDNGIPRFTENPRNIAVSDYDPKTCEQSLAQLGTISPNCPTILSPEGIEVPGPIGSGTNLLPQGVNSTDVFAKAAYYLHWDPSLRSSTIYSLTGSIAWDNRVSAEVNGVPVELTTLANYYYSFNSGWMIWNTAPIF